MCRSFVPSPASAITPLVIVSSYTSSMMRIFNPIKMQSILPHYLSLLGLMFESSEVIQTWLLAGMIVLRSRAYSKACLKDKPSFYMSRDHAAGCKRTQITDWHVYIYIRTLFAMSLLPSSTEGNWQRYSGLHSKRDQLPRLTIHDPRSGLW